MKGYESRETTPRATVPARSPMLLAKLSRASAVRKRPFDCSTAEDDWIPALCGRPRRPSLSIFRSARKSRCQHLPCLTNIACFHTVSEELAHWGEHFTRIINAASGDK